MKPLREVTEHALAETRATARIVDLYQGASGPLLPTYKGAGSLCATLAPWLLGESGVPHLPRSFPFCRRLVARRCHHHVMMVHPVLFFH